MAHGDRPTDSNRFGLGSAVDRDKNDFARPNLGLIRPELGSSRSRRARTPASPGRRSTQNSRCGPGSPKARLESAKGGLGHRPASTKCALESACMGLGSTLKQTNAGRGSPIDLKEGGRAELAPESNRFGLVLIRQKCARIHPNSGSCRSKVARFDQPWSRVDQLNQTSGSDRPQSGFARPKMGRLGRGPLSTSLPCKRALVRFGSSVVGFRQMLINFGQSLVDIGARQAVFGPKSGRRRLKVGGHQLGVCRSRPNPTEFG